MSDRSIELKSPKLGYIPIRQFLIIGSILGILYAYSFISAPYPPPYPTIVSYTFAALTFAFNACLFYGALKNNGIALGCCQKVLMFSMVLSLVAFCFMPVLASSLVSSRYDDFSDATNFKIKELLVDIFGLRTMEEYADFDRKHGGYKPTAGQKFLLGVVFGEMFVVALIVYTSLFYVEYFMIKRLRKFIAARKGMYKHQMLA